VSVIELLEKNQKSNISSQDSKNLNERINRLSNIEKEVREEIEKISTEKERFREWTKSLGENIKVQEMFTKFDTQLSGLYEKLETLKNLREKLSSMGSELIPSTDAAKTITPADNQSAAPTDIADKKADREIQSEISEMAQVTEKPEEAKPTEIESDEIEISEEVVKESETIEAGSEKGETAAAEESIEEAEEIDEKVKEPSSIESEPISTQKGKKAGSLEDKTQLENRKKKAKTAVNQLLAEKLKQGSSKKESEQREDKKKIERTPLNSFPQKTNTHNGFDTSLKAEGEADVAPGFVESSATEEISTDSEELRHKETDEQLKREKYSKYISPELPSELLHKKASNGS